MATTLLDLPDELIIAILGELDDLPALRAIACCSHQFQALAEPHIYRDIFFRSGDAAVRLANSLRARKERCRAVRKLDIRCKYRRSTNKLPEIAKILRMVTHIQDLTLESPYCNNNRWMRSKGWDALMKRLLNPLVHSAGMLASAEPKPLQSLTTRMFK